MTEGRQELAPGFWVVDGECVSFYSVPYSTRMVVVRLSGGGLWVWSPIALTAELAAWIDRLGAPAHLVGPNPIHHLFLAEWKERWPEAKIWGPQSLVDKRADLPFDGVLDDRPPAEWGGDFKQYHFTNSRLLDELVFLHLPTKSVIFADLSENFSRAFVKREWAWWQRPIARLWKIVEPFGYAPLEIRLTFRHRERARAMLADMLAHDPQRVIMAHGEIAKENGAAYMRKAFAWLGLIRG